MAGAVNLSKTVMLKHLAYPDAYLGLSLWEYFVFFVILML